MSDRRRAIGYGTAIARRYQYQTGLSELSNIAHERAPLFDKNDGQWASRILAALVDTMPIGVLICDSKGIVVLSNHAARHLLGIHLGSARDCWPQSLPQQGGSPLSHVESPLARAVDHNETTQDQEIRVHRADGSQGVILVSCGPVCDDSGALVGAIAILQDISERKENERAASRMAAIVESTDDAVLGVGRDGLVDAWNRGAEKLYGFSASEMRSRPISTLVPPERMAEFEAMLERVRTGVGVDYLETVRLRKDGSRVRVALTVSPIRDRDGRLSGMSWIARDETARSEMEQALRASEERFRSIYREAPIGIELYDENGRLVDANRACLDLFGVAEVSDVVGFDLFADPNLAHGAKDELRRGQTVRYQTDFDLAKAKALYKSSRSGELLLDVLITPLGPNHGKPITGYLVHVQDITKRMQAQRDLERVRGELEIRVAQRTAELAESNRQLRKEAAERRRLLRELRQKNEQLVAATEQWKEQAEMARRRADEREAIIASIADAVFICDRDGRIVDVNQAALKFVGRNEEEVLGQPLVDFLFSLQVRRADGRPVAANELAITQALAGTVVNGQEEMARSPVTQRDVNVLVSAAPLHDDHGETIGVVEVVSDISRIREYDRLKDQFIAVAAHELKTPVAIMKGYAQALLRASQSIPAPQRRMLDAINRGSDKIDRVVKDLLDVSRLHLGRMDLMVESIDLAALLDEVVDRSSLILPKHRLRVAVAEPVVVQGDKDRLEQVLANLIDNATKYSPDGGDIDISVRRNHEAVVSIRDHGIGIPKDKQEHIFERFYRAHSGTANDYGGLGVGLYISKEIAARHGGRMWFDSEEGRGSTFHFSLPIGNQRYS